MSAEATTSAIVESSLKDDIKRERTDQRTHVNWAVIIYVVYKTRDSLQITSGRRAVVGGKLWVGLSDV